MKRQFKLVAVSLCAAAVMLGTSSCNQTKTGEVTPCTITMSDSCSLPIAYINIDSLLLNYDFAKDLNEELIKKTEEARMNLNSQAQSLDKEVADFQRKLQTNAFLSEERAQNEANRLQQKKDKLDQLNLQLQQELAQQQAQMNAQLGDTIRTFLRAYNAEKKFEMIFSNTMYDNILIDFPKYDITAEVLGLLNEKYEQSKAKK